MHYLSPPVGTPETVAAAKGHAADILPLGAARLGYLRHRCVDSGVLQLPPRPAFDASFGALSDYRRPYLRPDRSCVDIFAVIGTVFGVATSLGYGVLQVNAGLNHLLACPSTIPCR